MVVEQDVGLEHDRLGVAASMGPEGQQDRWTFSIRIASQLNQDSMGPVAL